MLCFCGVRGLMVMPSAAREEEEEEEENKQKKKKKKKDDVFHVLPCGRFYMQPSVCVYFTKTIHRKCAYILANLHHEKSCCFCY